MRSPAPPSRRERNNEPSEPAPSPKLHRQTCGMPNHQEGSQPAVHHPHMHAGATMPWFMALHAIACRETTKSPRMHASHIAQQLTHDVPRPALDGAPEVAIGVDAQQRAVSVRNQHAAKPGATRGGVIRGGITRGLVVRSSSAIDCCCGAPGSIGHAPSAARQQLLP